ncbi:MAG: nickel-dependent hydrogenase large subunit [Deltaproteobacteria bacterium]|nr:MAG: nickel-dependent hydrogenase large subunit [Deltaproteobacteria bacterium]
MAKKITIDPLTRIEGHLKIEVDVEGGKVVNAKSSGMLFRGFELILKGRDPRDAPQITQRICGVCPTAHGTASVRCLDMAFGIKPPTNGRLVRNLILGANYIQSHVLHFFHLAALDYVKGPNTAPFVPRYDGPGIYKLSKAVNNKAVEAYLKALDLRRKAHEMLAIFGGKVPHVQALIPGGVTEPINADKIIRFYWSLQELKEAVNTIYLPTVYLVGKAYGELFKVGKGHKNVLSYGVFPMDDDDKTFLLKQGVYTKGKDYPLDVKKITEEIKYSWYNDKEVKRYPGNGYTDVTPDKKGGYSFIKAPRYNGLPHEVGPLARMWITNPVLSKHANAFLGVPKSKDVRMRDLGDKAFSIIGRHVARAEECWYVILAMEKWIDQLQLGKPVNTQYKIPKQAEGYGLSEAPRGSVGHWISIKDGKIANYQIVAPTTWNASPSDNKETRGPIEEALIGAPVPDMKNPVNVARVVRSFDP